MYFPVRGQDEDGLDVLFASLLSTAMLSKLMLTVFIFCQLSNKVYS